MNSKENDYEILQVMKEIGGGFASSIAVAAQHADAENYLRLKTAFPELWEEYAGLAEWTKENYGFGQRSQKNGKL